MNLNKIATVIRQCAGEFFLIFCGLVLVFFPGAAVSLGVKIIAWVLLATGILSAVSALLRSPQGLRGLILPVLGIILGGYMLSHPLVITNAISRVLGLYLVIQGAGNLRGGNSRIVAILTMGAGVVLFLLPQTLLNTLMGAAGVVLVIIGAINLIDNLRRHRYLNGGSENPNIIDAVSDD